MTIHTEWNEYIIRIFSVYLRKLALHDESPTTVLQCYWCVRYVSATRYLSHCRTAIKEIFTAIVSVLPHIADVVNIIDECGQFHSA